MAPYAAMVILVCICYRNSCWQGCCCCIYRTNSRYLLSTGYSKCRL